MNLPCVLSALRLCVWLFDNCGIQLLYIDDCFLLAFGAVQGKVFKHRIASYLNPRFAVTDRTQYKICLFHCFNFKITVAFC